MSADSVDPVDWLPRLDERSPLPLYEQVVEQVAMAIAQGQLAPGDPLPSIRGLAARLRINPNTAARIARELERLGLAEAARGLGSVVSRGAPRAAGRIAAAALEREMAALVAVARQLGMTREGTLQALGERWKEPADAADAG